MTKISLPTILAKDSKHTILSRVACGYNPLEGDT